MPQNKPMKIQWITVNGRQVPLVLPQTYSYKDDDWKITSDQDPLPIVEYGTTAGGIVVPKRVSNEGHELTQLTGSNTEYVFLEYVELTAGSTVYTEAQDYNGSRLGVNVRFNNAIKHRVRGFLLSKQAGRGVGGVVDIIDSRNTAATQTRGSLQMTTTRVNIGITNDDVIDTQVNLVSIVDFII